MCIKCKIKVLQFPQQNPIKGKYLQVLLSTKNPNYLVNKSYLISGSPGHNKFDSCFIGN